MSLSDLTNRDLQLWRNVEGARDAFNQPTFTLELADVVSGRIVPVSDRVGVQAEGTRAIVSLFDCILDEPLEVTERDTIIDDESGVYEVLQAAIADDMTGPHHTELVLEQVTNPST